MKTGGNSDVLYNRVSHLFRFTLKFVNGLFRIAGETALAIKAEALSVWELEIPPLGQFTTASGASWEAYEYGVWHLVESKRCETKTAVSELLDYLGFPFLFLNRNIMEKSAFVDILASSVELGFSLPVEYIKEAYCSKSPQTDVKTGQDAKKAGPDSEPGDASQNGINGNDSLSTLEPSTDNSFGPIAHKRWELIMEMLAESALRNNDKPHDKKHDPYLASGDNPQNLFKILITQTRDRAGFSPVIDCCHSSFFLGFSPFSNLMTPARAKNSRSLPPFSRLQKQKFESKSRLQKKIFSTRQKSHFQ